MVERRHRSFKTALRCHATNSQTYIKERLTALIQCGFKSVASVCDQGGTNIAAINLLIQETWRSLPADDE